MDKKLIGDFLNQIADDRDDLIEILNSDNEISWMMNKISRLRVMRSEFRTFNNANEITVLSLKDKIVEILEKIENISEKYLNANKVIIDIVDYLNEEAEKNDEVLLGFWANVLEQHVKVSE